MLKISLTYHKSIEFLASHQKVIISSNFPPNFFEISQNFEATSNQSDWKHPVPLSCERKLRIPGADGIFSNSEVKIKRLCKSQQVLQSVQNLLFCLGCRIISVWLMPRTSDYKCGSCNLIIYPRETYSSCLTDFSLTVFPLSNVNQTSSTTGIRSCIFRLLERFPSSRNLCSWQVELRDGVMVNRFPLQWLLMHAGQARPLSLWGLRGICSGPPPPPS